MGLSTGTAVAKIGVNSLIVTLGMSSILTGIVIWYTNSQSIITGVSKDLTDLGSGDWLGLPRGRQASSWRAIPPWRGGAVITASFTVRPT